MLPPRYGGKWFNEVKIPTYPKKSAVWLSLAGVWACSKPIVFFSTFQDSKPLEAYQEPGHARLQRIHEERARDWAPPELLGTSDGSNRHFFGEHFGARPQIPAILGVNCRGFDGFLPWFCGFCPYHFLESWHSSSAEGCLADGSQGW